ncbi:MAG: N-acetylmuramoyl-L-alanine amidase [Eubacterium sp.]|nr:N-acetylmuramoyl-L-alanine amidase [Eubacterium sp.]
MKRNKKLNKRKYIIGFLGVLILGTLLFGGCGNKSEEAAGQTQTTAESVGSAEAAESAEAEKRTEAETDVSDVADTAKGADTESGNNAIKGADTMESANTEENIDSNVEADTDTDAESANTEENIDSNVETDTNTGAEPANTAGQVVVIDAGHQAQGNSEQEPVGPGASETKAKVSSGTSGCSTGVPEYQLTLDISLKLGAELEDRGYTVIYTRTSNDVNISNSERAAVANEAQADAFVRIHANGSEDSSVQGAMTICQTASNPYNAEYYEQSRRLSDCVLDGLTAETGCTKQYVWETDTMSGINWCMVPVTIVEMGYMSNPEEDARMQDESYQSQIVTGIANGIEQYLGN